MGVLPSIQPPPVAGRPPPPLGSAQVARELEDQAGRLSPEHERDALLKRVRQMDIANYMNK